MDTKLKKFNRSLFTKTACFLLAVAVAVTGFAKALNFLIEAYTSNEVCFSDSSYFETLVLQGDNFNLETSEVFYDEYKNFYNAAFRKGIIYTDESKSAYNKYQKNYESLIQNLASNKKANILSILEEESGSDYYANTFDFEVNGLISLKKVSDIPKDENSLDFYYSYGIEYDIDYDYIYNENITEQTTQVSKDLNEISDDILKKAGKCDAVVKIQNAYKEEEFYCGYYAVTVNDDVLMENAKKAIYDFPHFSSYEEFLDGAKSNNNILSKYKNLYYAFYFENSKTLFTNHPSLNSKSSEEKVKKAFSQYSWNYLENYKNGYVESSESITKIINSSIPNYREKMFSSVLSSTYYGDISSLFASDLIFFTALEDDFENEDVISNIASNYKYLKNEIFSLALYEAVMILIFIVLVIKLILSSGRNNTSDTITLLPTDYIFTSLRYAINTSLIWGCIWLIYELLTNTLVDIKYVPFIVKIGVYALGAAITVLIIDLVLYTSRHIKNKTFFKNFILGRLISLAVKIAKNRHTHKKAKNQIVYKDIYKNVLFKICLFICLPNIVSAFFLTIFCFSGNDDTFLFLLFLLFIYDCIVVFYMVKYVYHLRSIFKQLNEIANGNYDVYMEINGMPKSIIPYAEDLNALRNGLKIAVENAIKEERTKTELITNVSHDLKTPLTSIITYVDLLSHCNIEDDTAKEYISVLSDKGLRLKRLIEDLLEASKASSGNIECNPMKVSINELIMQFAAEYEDEFNAKGLKLVINGTEDNLAIMADSKISYRILDNLMTNIRKYAMENTRVYLDIQKEENKAVLTLKNISESQLNISAKELMERFVRGDSSRSGDGNGLGLSIAENLARLQGGNLFIEICGDMFTAKVEFLLAN